MKFWQTGRIIYYQDHADADYWDNQWRESINKEFFRRYEEGCLDDYSSVFLKYLKKEDAILEAGCGTGKYVLALRSRGFEKVEGLEWGQETVQNVKSLYPDLPIYVGDVTKVEKPNNYYDGYISLGVVEHRLAGPNIPDELIESRNLEDVQYSQSQTINP
jgi:SAM-dependent methyltransferase